MGSTHKLTREVLTLREQGWSMPRIARHFGTSTAGVYTYIKRRLPHLAKRRTGLEQVDARPLGQCDICGDDAQLDADHDHTTNQQRGLLCRSCNQGLGFFHESIERLERAAHYLTAHKARGLTYRPAWRAVGNVDI